MIGMGRSIRVVDGPGLRARGRVGVELPPRRPVPNGLEQYLAIPKPGPVEVLGEVISELLDADMIPPPERDPI